MDELRLAIRRLTKRPGVSIVSIVTLACAIGAAVAGTILTLALMVSVRPALRAARVDLGTVLKDQ